MAEEAKTTINHFRVVGYLIPSNTGKSYKVMVGVHEQQRFIGLVAREALLKSLRAWPMRTVEISVFIDNPCHEKQMVQRILEIVPTCNPEKIVRTEQP